MGIDCASKGQDGEISGQGASSASEAQDGSLATEGRSASFAIADDGRQPCDRKTNALGFAQGLFFVGMRKLSQEVRYLSYFRNPEIIKQ